VTPLTVARDFYRAMADAAHKPECTAPVRDSWASMYRRRPDPACPDCNPPADRALFAQLADEIDAYLTAQADQPAADEPMWEA